MDHQFRKEAIIITELETITAQTIDDTDKKAFWSKLSLISLGIVMIAIGVFLRYIDIFVLNSDVFWTNILLSKLLSLVILLWIFWRYRIGQLDSVLGLSRYQLRGSVIIGIILGLTIIMVSNVLSLFVYSLFDPSIPIVFSVLLGPPMLVYTFAFFFINAVYEETLFRGLLQNGIRERFGPSISIFLSAVIFGLWHIIWPIQDAIETGIFPWTDAIVKVVFSGIMGGVFGIYYEKFASRKTLVATITAHTLINYVNEGFKFAFDTATEGPDLSFLNPVHMTIGLMLALGTFIMLSIFFWKYKYEQVIDRMRGALQRFHK